MSTKILLSCCLFLILSISAFADGGRLILTECSPDHSLEGWPLMEESLSVKGEAATLTVTLPDETTKPAYVFESEAILPRRVLLTDSQTRYLLVDENKDGTFSESMVYLCMEDEQTSMPDDMDAREMMMMESYLPSGTFISQATATRVLMPVASGADAMKIPIDLVVQMEPGTDSRSLVVDKIHACFSGTIRLGTEEYQAQLEPCTLFWDKVPAQGIVLLDSNRDGRFDHMTDIWFQPNGLLLVDGVPWQARTTIEGTTAEVTVEPYTGDCGSLSIQGTGAVRTYMSYTRENTTDSSLLLLSPVSGNRYRCPSGHYDVRNSYIIPSDSPDYFLSWVSDNQNISFSLLPGEHRQVPLGGPLTMLINIQTYGLRGDDVPFSCSSITNAQSQQYHLFDNKKGRPSTPGAFEVVVKDKIGNEIARQEANSYWDQITMPLFAWGHFRLEIARPDLEILECDCPEFYYFPRKECLVFGGLMFALAFSFGAFWIARRLSIGRIIMIPAMFATFLIPIMGTFLESEMLLIFSSLILPPVSTFLTFAVWRLFKIRNRFLLLIIPFLVSFQICAFYGLAIVLITGGTDFSYLPFIIAYVAFVGYFTAVPLSLARLELLKNINPSGEPDTN